MKKLFFRPICLGIVLYLAAFAGCQNPLDPPEAGIPGGKGRVVVNIGGAADKTARTVAPDLSGFTYTLSFSGPEPKADMELDYGSTSTTLELAAGNWTITVTALAEAGGNIEPVAEGTGTLNVSAGQSHSVDIVLAPLSGGVKGRVEFRVALDMNSAPTVRDLIVSNAEGVEVKKVDIWSDGGILDHVYRLMEDLDPGVYKLEIRIRSETGANAKYAGLTEVFHIYSGQTTRIPDKIFSDEDYQETVTDLDLTSLIPAPAAWAAPLTHFDDTSQYYRTRINHDGSAVRWTLADGTAFNGVVFAPNTVYKAEVELVTHNNYTLMGLPENIFTHGGADAVTNAEDANLTVPDGPNYLKPYGTVYITFPATGARSISGVTVDPSSITLNQGDTQTFTATVTGDAGDPPTPQNVAWTVTGNSSAGTTITPNGLLTVAINEENPSLTIRATSAADTTQYGEVTVAVNVVVYTPINSQADLANIANDPTGKYRLNTDITLTNWMPLGTSSATYFKGVFDGNGKTITVQSFDNSALSGSYLGIFGYVYGASAASRAELKNLNIVSALPANALTLTGTGTKNVGLLVGYARNADISGITLSGTPLALESDRNFSAGSIVGDAMANVKIADCHSTADINITSTNTGITRCGGIIGNASASTIRIEDCSFIGGVSISNTTGQTIVGGIAGVGGFIENCRVEGTITGTGGAASAYLGGIAGDSKKTISRSYFKGTVSGTTSSCLGGIAGYLSSEGGIEDCYSSGSVTGISNAGGIAGLIIADAVSVTRCYSTVIVTCSSTDQTVNNGTGLGGIVGSNSSRAVTPAYGIADCAALNPEISGGIAPSLIHRISGNNTTNRSATDNNNHAWSGMTITATGGTYTPDIGADKQDGADLAEQKPLQVFYESTLGWDFTTGTGVWEMVVGKDYPQLQWQN